MHYAEMQAFITGKQKEVVNHDNNEMSIIIMIEIYIHRSIE